EPENLGMISSLLTEGLEMAGQSAAGRVEALRALPLLSPYRRSNFLGSHLGLVAGYARTDGLHLAALAVMDEVIDATAALDKPQVMAWAHGERARILLEIGQADRARSELEEATRWADRIQAGLGRDEIRAEVMLARGQLLRPTDPRAARDELLRAVAALRASHSEITLPNALYQAALAARDAGDTATARRCLTQAVGEIEMRRAMFPTAEVRASFYETMERVFDAMVGLELDAGRPDAAFAYLERARAAAWGPSAATAGRTAATIGGLQRHLPSDALAVEYALLPDRLVVWTLTRRAWRHRSFPVPRDSIAALVTRFVEEAGGSEVTADGARVRLFDLLLRPIAGELAAVSKVAIVPDRELSQLPFVALWDSTTRKYVVQTHAVQTLPSAAFLGSAAAAAGRAGAAAAGGGALVIGDPAFDSVAMPRVERLPGAAREAADVAQLYRRVHLVTGTAARRDTVLALLPGQSVFHFAGHAVANGEQPELSYLALAADQAADQVADGGMLRAREIGRLRLSNLRIVILSACSTLGARPSHVGAIAGLAYSFLRAGVPATVSSLWDVDDGTTTPLLVAFHQRLAEGVPAAEALRRAQVEALGSPKSVLHAPRAWAAFIYTGP
ncbi:MAG TPA: CHAT domain-containing protein, partial [Gemmatimonadaceae bacterium]|nr:CHAT domain-containing protein [Gemmatimonadaceae bacterium]